MIDERLILIGSWVEVVGLVSSAIGASKQLTRLGDVFLAQLLVVIGEALQSLGNALQGLGGELDDLGTIGDFVESAGAAGSSRGAALQLTEDSEEGLKLEIIGDSLQALGSAMQAEAAEEQVLILANELQSIGAAMEAIGGVHDLKENEELALQLGFVGSWAQAAGGIMQALYLTRGG